MTRKWGDSSLFLSYSGRAILEEMLKNHPKDEKNITNTVAICNANESKKILATKLIRFHLEDPITMMLMMMIPSIGLNFASLPLLISIKLGTAVTNFCRSFGAISFSPRRLCLQSNQIVHVFSPPISIVAFSNHQIRWAEPHKASFRLKISARHPCRAYLRQSASNWRLKWNNASV